MTCPRPDKVRFGRSIEARAARQRVFWQTGQWLEVYRCRCQCWHLGKSRKAPRDLQGAADHPGRYRNHHPLHRAA